MNKGFLGLLCRLLAVSLCIHSLVFPQKVAASLDYSEYTEDMANFLARYNSAAAYQGAKNGFKTVIYVSPEEMGRQASDYDKGMYIAAGSGVYTSADGIHWAVMHDSVSAMGGGEGSKTSKTLRQAIAYGGVDEKKMLGTSTTGTNASIYVYPADFSQQLSIPAYTYNSQSIKQYIYLSTVVWDKYTHKFWCSANEISASTSGTITSRAGIYYSDGIVSENEMLWTKVDLGDCDFYSNATATASNCIYPYISTDDNGTLTYYPSLHYATGDNKYKFGIISTNSEVTNVSVTAVNMNGITIYEPGAETGVVLNNVAANTGNVYGATSVSSAILDGNGNVILGLMGTNNPTATRIAMYNIETGRLEWIKDQTKSRGTQKMVASNGEKAVSIAMDAANYTTSSRENGTYNVMMYDYSNSSYGDGISALKTTADEMTVYNSDNHEDGNPYKDYYYISSAVIGPDDTVIISQVVKDSTTSSHRGRLVTLKLEDKTDESGAVIGKEYKTYTIEKVGADAYFNIDTFYVRASSDDTWSSSSLGVIMVREKAKSNLTDVTSYTGWQISGSVYYRWLSSGLDFEILPTRDDGTYFDSTGFGLTANDGERVDGNKQFLAGGTYVRLVMPNAQEAKSGKLRMRISSSSNRTQYKEADFSFTVIPDEYITVNGALHTSEVEALSALQKGTNVVQAKYNVRPQTNLSDVLSAVAVYKIEGGVKTLVNVGAVSTPLLAQNTKTAELPSASMTFDIPENDSLSNYVLKTFYWTNLIPY